MPKILTKLDRMQRIIDCGILIDAEAADSLTEYTWRVDTHGYAVTNNPYADGPSKLYMHRFVMSAEVGQYVDHINGNKLDNRRANLAVGSQSDNMRNVSSKNRPQDLPRCVYIRNSGRYSVQVRSNINLGTFETIEEAIYARDAWYKVNGYMNGAGVPLSHSTE